MAKFSPSAAEEVLLQTHRNLYSTEPAFILVYNAVQFGNQITADNLLSIDGMGHEASMQALGGLVHEIVEQMAGRADMKVQDVFTQLAADLKRRIAQKEKADSR